MAQHFDVIIVGGGLSGLTAAAYLARAKHNVLLIEKEDYVGGLVGSFTHQGFTFDRGARSIESSGIVLPMIKDLNLPIEFVLSPVTMQIGTQKVILNSFADIAHYEAALIREFPTEDVAIKSIMKDIYNVMNYMDVLYGIDNPLFMKMPPDPVYLRKVLLPWLFKLMPNLRKAMKFMDPIQVHLQRYTKNTALIDMITQHFFENTPAFFALSYFTLYLDYRYPKGGTQVIADQLKAYILAHKGEVQLRTKVTSINPEQKVLKNDQGTHYSYDHLIWAADIKHLYRAMKPMDMKSKKIRRTIINQRRFLNHKKGADSVLTLYAGSSLPSSFYQSFSGPHAFITPQTTGLSVLPLSDIKEKGHFIIDKEAIFNWVARHLELTTYEISIPALRDASLAPVNQTGLIISVLFNYDLAHHIEKQGWYNEFKEFVQSKIIQIMEQHVFPGWRSSLLHSFIATPLTLERYTNSTGGSLSGWSFANNPFPAVYEFTKVTQSVKTPLPHISQCGQWTFNPAGVPVAVLTGRLAADRAIKGLK